MTRSRPRRHSLATLAVLQVMVSRPTESHYGLEVSEQADLATGTVYPILRRLEQDGWVTSSWEDVDPSEESRPRRRLYFLTGAGARLAREALAEHSRRFHLTQPVASPGITT